MTPTTSSPKVTAIVSTYASARFIRGCLDDLLSQTLYAQGQLEILVIDSGSPENESALVQEYMLRFANIRLERTTREPLYAAWNRALALAKGTYLTSANTDDRHSPEALETLAAHLDANPDTAVVFADSLITTGANETWDNNTAQGCLGWPTFSYEELQRRCIVGPQPLWRKALHQKWGNFDASLRVAGDYEFWLRIGKQERLDRYPATLGLYYQNPQGLEHGSGSVTQAETFAVQQRYSAAPRPVAPALSAPLSFVVTKAEPPRDAKPPTVSVIIPTFNRPEFLGRALHTLCAQTLKDFEVVVVNDCGDPLEDLLATFQDRLSITYIRHGVNRDRAAARNTGIRASAGLYIAYLDDDDGYRPQHLEMLVSGMRREGCLVAYAESEWIEEVKTDQGYQAVRSSRDRNPAFDWARLMVVNYIPILALMHARECLDEVGMFDESLGTHEDWDLFIRLANRYRFAHVAHVTSDVSLRSDGSSTTSGNRPDFIRTLKIVHARYRHLVVERQDILKAQLAIFPSPVASPVLAAPEPPAVQVSDAISRFQSYVGQLTAPHGR